MGKPDSKQQAAPNRNHSQAQTPEAAAAAGTTTTTAAAAAASRPAGVTATSEPTCRGPYTPFPFTVPHVYLEVSIQPGTTRVTSVVDYVPLQPSSSSSSSSSSNNSSSTPQQSLALRGEDLEILELSLDGEVLPEGAYTWDPKGCELLVHHVPPQPFQLRCVTAIHPEQHTDLEGLFCVGGVYATQCEATQFSLLTVVPDRPDILSLWRVRVEAPQASCPVLLSNGNMVGAGELQGGRHFTVWEDPYPKPCYLFSVVAGDLALREDTHRTHTGRDVRLQIYVPRAYIEQLGEALTAIKAAMTWDEAAFGREYDLDTYTMVGLEGFNDDATETKGISLFSIHILAATPSANTDGEVETIRSLVAHEYFHNWSGNRVTLRDWLNLTVKEGLTVYREQQFMADLDAAAAAAAVTAPYGSTDWEPELLLHLYSIASSSAGGHNAPAAAAATSDLSAPASAAADAAKGGHEASGASVCTGDMLGCLWRRVLEAGHIREEQWPEDDGPLAHPIRPSQVKSLDSMYTDTVYAKGAAVVRMFRFLLGPSGFTDGVKAFFDSNDGKAVPCEAFCEALCAANPSQSGLLRGLLPWYDTPGTPTLTISSSYSPSSESLTLTIKQRNDTARGVDKALHKPLLIPVKIGLVGPDGRDLPLHLKPCNSSSTKHKGSSKVGNSKPRTSPQGVITDTGLQGTESTSLVLLVDSWSQSFTFTRLPEKPCVSLLRDFSAPVRLDVEGETDRSLGFLAVHDSNPFARWDALQRLLCRLLTRLYDIAEQQDSIDDMEALTALLAESGGMPPALLAALEAALAAVDLDGEYQAQLLQLPSVAQVVSLLDESDPVLLWMVWVYVGQQLARSLQQQLQDTIRQCGVKLQQLDAGFGPAATKARALKNAALGLLSFNWDEQLEQQVLERYYSASCMTDRLAALELLVDEDSPARTAALQHFHDTYSSQPLAMLKWLYVQAASDLEGNVANVAALMEHPVFDITNPQACEHLLWGFAASVPNFHEEGGSGYAFMVDAILKVDKVNTQMAASLVTTLVDWEAFDEDRQQLMLAQLKRFIALEDNVSEGVMEVVRQAIRY